MKTFKIVIIDNKQSHFDLMKRAIINNFPHFSVYHFEEAGSFLESFDEINPDVIITDYIMPDMNGIELLEILNNEGNQIPVIMITGHGNETVAVRAMKLGVHDYLVKSDNFFNLLPGILAKVIEDRTFGKELNNSEKRFLDLAATTADWIWEIDSSGKYTYTNHVSEKIIGYSHDEVIGSLFYDFFPDRNKEWLKSGLLSLMAKKKLISAFDACLLHKNGEEVFVEISGLPFFDDAGKIMGYRGIDHDITQRKRAENLRAESLKEKDSILAELTIKEELVRQEREAFSKIAEAVVYTKDVPDFCKKILAGLVNILGFDRGSVRLFETGSISMNVVATVGLAKKMEKELKDNKDNSMSISAFVAKKRKPIFAQDSLKHNLHKSHGQRLNAFECRAFISWPVIDAGKDLLGVLQLFSKTPKKISHHERTLFEIVARMFAVVLKRKQMERDLYENEEKFRKIFSESPLAILLFDEAGNHIISNESFLKMFGVSKASRLKSFNLFHSPNLTDKAKAELLETGTYRSEIIYDFEKMKQCKLYHTKKSDYINLELLISRLEQNGKIGFRGYLAQVQNITARKNAEASIRKLTQQLINSQEIERQRVSDDLHDNLAQDLSTLKINIDTLINSIDDVSPDIRQRVSKFSKLIEKTIVKVRKIAYEIRPAGLNNLGLAQTVRQYCEEFSETNGINIDFAAAGMEKLNLDFDIKITIFRLIKEGLNNIKKHSKANMVKIRLIASFPDIILRINDNGKGFDVEKRGAEAIAEKRMGLWSMKERVDYLYGNIDIESKPDYGTKIIIKIPIKENNGGSQENSINY